MGESWPMFTALAGLVAAWTLLIFGVIKMMLTKNCKSIEEMGEKALAVSSEQDKKSRDLEKSILELKADLPLNYVRKEDFIRHEVVINTKLDRLRDLIEGMKEAWRNQYGK